MRFLCAGDLHLGAGPDLGREPGERLADQEAVLGRIVELANELEATLLFAGDAWERRRPTPAELLAFRRPLEKTHGGHGYGLRRAGVVIAGNHDVEAFERPTGFDAVQTGRHWHYVAQPHVLGLGEAQIACLPWAPPGRLVALEGRENVNERLAAGLLDVARGLFAETDPARPRILLAHWSVSGASTPTGISTDLFREPVLDAAELAAIGYDAVVLGHIHKPQVLTRADAPPVFYVGSPMPLNFGEAGCEHGCYLLDVEPGKAEVYFVPLESRRLVELELRGDEVEIPAGQADELAGAIVKVKIHADEEQARRLDVAALKADLEAFGAHKVWSVQVEVDRADRQATREPLDETIDDRRALELWLEANGVTVSPVDGGPLPEYQGELVELATRYFQEAAR